MKKISLLFFVTLVAVSLSGCDTRKSGSGGVGPFKIDENSVMGCWEGTPDVKDETSYQYHLQVRPDQVSMEMTCKKNEQIVKAIAKSRASVSEKIISIQEDVESTEKGEGDFFCQALLQKMDLNYTIQNKQLKVHFPGSSDQVTFSRCP